MSTILSWGLLASHCGTSGESSKLAELPRPRIVTRRCRHEIKSLELQRRIVWTEMLLFPCTICPDLPGSFSYFSVRETVQINCLDFLKANPVASEAYSNRVKIYMSLYLQEFNSDLNSHLHVHLYEFILVVSTDFIEAEFNTKATNL